jgi:hypothetical protein
MDIFFFIARFPLLVKAYRLYLIDYASSPSPSVGVFSDQCREAAKIGSAPTEGDSDGLSNAASEQELEGGAISANWRFVRSRSSFFYEIIPPDEAIVKRRILCAASRMSQRDANRNRILIFERISTDACQIDALQSEALHDYGGAGSRPPSTRSHICRRSY